MQVLKKYSFLKPDPLIHKILMHFKMQLLTPLLILCVLYLLNFWYGFKINRSLMSFLWNNKMRPYYSLVMVICLLRMKLIIFMSVLQMSWVHWVHLNEIRVYWFSSVFFFSLFNDKFLKYFLSDICYHVLSRQVICEKLVHSISI